MKLNKDIRKKVLLGILTMGVMYSVLNINIDGRAISESINSNSMLLTSRKNAMRENSVVSDSADISRNNGVREKSSYKYDGSGSVIAVIDSGMNVHDSAFSNIDGSHAKIDESFVNGVKSKLNAKGGRYINNKIPFAFDYYDKDDDVLNPSNSHGTHVAGISAGNSDDVKGVAPNAQILAMKVFSDEIDGGTNFDLIADAIDDAVMLKADTINISIGSRSGSLRDVSEKLKKSINNAISKGIVVNVASGNDGFNSWGVNKPLAFNPDYSTISSPALFGNSFAVASSEYNPMVEKKIIIKTKKPFESLLKNKIKGSLDFVNLTGSELEERDYDFTIKKYSDYKGKVAVIKLGKDNLDSINKKISELNNVSGLILISKDNSVGKIVGLNGEKALSTNLPVYMISKKDGEFLLNNSRNTAIKVAKEKRTYEFSSKISQNDFSSWGYSPEIGIKPEISAFGGGVLSSINDSKRAFANGTSMATPQVSGAILLLSQKYKDVDGVDKFNFFKNILMSTAVPSKDPNSFNYISPRKQGAGNMNLKAALDAKAYIVDSKTGESKVNLGSLNDSKFNLE